MQITTLFPALADKHVKTAHGAKNASCTKAGPGRYAVQGEKTVKPPKPESGRFAGTHTNSAKSKQRALKVRFGSRQVRKLNKAMRRAQVTGEGIQ